MAEPIHPAVPDASSPPLERLLSYIERDPGNLILRKQAIGAARAAGDWAAARRLVDDGLLARANDPELLAASGLLHVQARNHADAEQALSAALAQGADAPELRCALAFALFMQRRHAGALETLGPAAVPLAVPSALLLRARCLHHLGRLPEAVADCRAHLGAQPQSTDTHGLLALLLCEQDLREQAQPHIEAALRLDPTQLEALLAQALLQFGAQDHEAARASFAALLQSHPHCGRAWLGLSLVELTQWRLDAAGHHAEQAAVHLPDHIGSWHVLAWTRLLQGDVAAAGRAFDAALALDRNFGETHGGLAVVAALQGREADARASARRAQRLNPQAMAGHHAEIVLLQQHGRQQEARAAFEAFLARPVARSDMQYRDLLTTHLQQLSAWAAGRHAARGAADP